MSPTNADATFVRSDATLEPQDAPDKLLRWWRAETAEHGYYCYKVEVLSDPPAAGGKSFDLKFRIVGTSVDLQVDLYLQNKIAWPEIPSTAQLAKKGQFALLLIDPEWLKAQGIADPAGIRFDGGKWPIVASL